MATKNQCDNCLKTFRYFSDLERHLVALRPCKKSIKDEEGNIISEKKFKCEDCCESYVSEYTLNRHKKGSCKGAKNIINNITNDSSNKSINDSYNSTDNSINIQNNTTNNSNVAINIGFLERFVKPQKEFEAIPDDHINIRNLEQYVSKFYDFPIYVDNIVKLIKSIINEMYIKNIPVMERTIMTISSKLKMHYYKDGKWNYDNCYDFFIENCIEKITKQLQEALMEKMYIIRKIRYNDKKMLKDDKNMADEEVNNIIDKKLLNIKNKVDDEGENLLHDKLLDKRYQVYQDLHYNLNNPVITTRVLGLMKDKFNVDNDLREIFKSLPIEVQNGDE